MKEDQDMKELMEVGGKKILLDMQKVDGSDGLKSLILMNIKKRAALGEV